jgi:hypothetical protein
MSWGNKLLLTFIVFASGMGYLVYRSTQVHFELVDKDYYKNELRYQEVIDATNQVNKLSEPVKLTQTGNGILLQLPAEMKDQSLSGNMHFYCAYDEKKDRKVNLQPNSDGAQLVPLSILQPGSYDVKVSWVVAGKRYFSSTKLAIP